MIEKHMQAIDVKEPAKAEVEMSPAERGEDTKGAEGAKGAEPVAEPAPGRIEIGLTNATRAIVRPLIAKALEARREAAFAEDRLSDAAIGIAACAGYELAQGTRFEFQKGEDGQFTSIVWVAK